MKTKKRQVNFSYLLTVLFVTGMTLSLYGQARKEFREDILVVNSDASDNAADLYLGNDTQTYKIALSRRNVGPIVDFVFHDRGWKTPDISIVPNNRIDMNFKLRALGGVYTRGLEVNGQSTIRNMVTENYPDITHFRRNKSNGNGGGAYIVINNTFDTRAIFGADGAGLFSSDAAHNKDLILGNWTAGGALKFITNNSGTHQNSMHITSDGEVGIGTNNPTEKLEVSGNIKATVGKFDRFEKASDIVTTF
ncbi:hypothetical protein, partial [Seonamhaeicola sp.]|uniref:hypothetical protein n=1 Tax=Seonamhaeicola sp. TaxID=1912245 RepID=UPI00261F77C0